MACTISLQSSKKFPVVAVHSDMGPHNVILSPTTQSKTNAIIEWEFAAGAPYASLHRAIEMLLRESAPKGFGAEYAHADELRDAFWGSIPEWNESEAATVFLKWFRFGLFIKAEGRPNNLNEEEKNRYWEENVRVVEGLLGKYPTLTR